MLTAGLLIAAFLLTAMILGHTVWRGRPWYIRFAFGCAALILGFLGPWIALTLIMFVFSLGLFFDIGFVWVLGALAAITGVIALLIWRKAPPAGNCRPPASTTSPRT